MKIIRVHILSMPFAILDETERELYVHKNRIVYGVAISLSSETYIKQFPNNAPAYNANISVLNFDTLALLVYRL